MGTGLRPLPVLCCGLIAKAAGSGRQSAVSGDARSDDQITSVRMPGREPCNRCGFNDHRVPAMVCGRPTGPTDQEGLRQGFSIDCGRPRSAWPRTVDTSRACAHRHDARSHEALFRRRADHHLHEIGSLFARERSLPYERVPCHERDRVADGCRRAHALTTSLAASRHQ